jgi:hypothetical protein
MQLLLDAQSLHLLTGFMQGNNHLFVCLFLVHFVLLFECVFLLCISEFILELFDDVQVSVGDFLVVVLDVIVLLRMLGCQFFDGDVLLVLNLLNQSLSLPLHLLSQQQHFVLVF